jgi:O-antigen ligase
MSFYLFILLTFFLLGRPQNFLPFLAVIRPVLVLTFLTLAATFLVKRSTPAEAISRSKEGRKYSLFYLMMILGIPFAVHRHVAFDFVILVYLSSILFFYLCLIHIDSIKRLKVFILTICLSVLFFGIASLIKGDFASGDRFLVKSMFDPNELSFFLVSLFPLSLYFIGHNEGLLKILLALTTIGISVITILLTGSRGGFLGLVAVFSLLLFNNYGHIRLPTKVLMLIVILTVVAAYGYKINTERYTSLANISSDYNVTAEDGRLGIWGKGVRLILSNPITGVGVNCFPEAIGELRAEEGEPPKWQAAHNSYLQVAAEVGLIGFFFFCSMITVSLKNLSFCIRTKSEYPAAQEAKLIAEMVRLGFIGSLIVAFFLSQAYAVVFTLFFALSTVVRNIALRSHDETEGVV